MNLEILTPDHSLWKGEVDLVQLPGADGSFEILNNHAPLIAVLKKGKIKIITSDKNKEFVEIKGGIIEVLNNIIIILAE